MCAAVEGRPGAIITVTCPGGCVELAVDAVTSALESARIAHRQVMVSRTGRVTPLSLPPDGEVLVIAEAQWASESDLAAVAEPLPDGGAVVMVHRTIPITRSLARAGSAARRNDAAFVLAPTTVAELRATAGLSAAEAERRVAATGGRADLLAALELDGSLVQDTIDRLSLLDPRARHAAELIAFGLDPVRLPLLMPAHDPEDPLVELEMEGLIERPPATSGIAPAPEMLDAVAGAVHAATGGARRAAVIEALVHDESGVLVVDLAGRLDTMGDRSPAAGEVYLRAAEQLAGLDPAATLVFVDAARAAAVTDERLVLAEATAAVGAGDPRRALATAAGHVGDELALVRAAAWVSLGDLGAAASCLDGTRLQPLARWARVGAGTPTADTDSRSPGTADDAAGILVEAVESWVAGDRDACVDALRRTLVRHHADPSTARWPVSPDVVAALMHAHLGHLERAERLMLDAIADVREGRPQRRAQLLTSAWLAATRGRLDDAADVLAGAAGPPLPPHEALWHAGVACTIAVRDAEPDSLVPAASAALAAADSFGTHLYDLGILTDIAAAAARAGIERVDELLAPAERAVERLGSPPALVADLAWARLRVALCCDDPVVLAEAARNLASLAVPAHHHLHLTLAQLLVRIDAGEVHAAAIEEISRELSQAGQPHEAARVCGIAAVRTSSESDARRLLKQSRLYRAQRAQLKRSERIDRDVVRLSEQEVRVAQLVLEGRTHREIGTALFISAKTVEHHVAHIRTKLGAGSRAELLAAIRSYLDAS